MGKGIGSVYQGRISGARWQQGRRNPQSSRTEFPVTDAKGDQHGVGQHLDVCVAQLSQQWSGACLSYTLKVVHSTLLGLLISVLAPLMASGEFPQELVCGWSCRHGCSGHAFRYLRCVSLPDVSSMT